MNSEIFTNLNIATMVDGYGIIENGAIEVVDGKIAWIGRASKLNKEKFKKTRKVYEGENRWVTPGLIECHTHLIFGGSRVNEFEMRLKGATYEEISKAGGGIFSTVLATRKASFEQLFESAQRRLNVFLAEGITTIEIKSGYGLDEECEIKILRVAAKLQESSYATVQRTFLGAHAKPKEYLGRENEYIDFLCDVMLPKIKIQNLADSVDAFCEKIAFTKDQTERLFSKAVELGFPVKLHAEQLSDQKSAILAAKYKALSVDHLEYLKMDGVKAISKSGTVAVLVPGSYYYLMEKKKPPIKTLRKAGVPIAISTDFNPGTSPINSLLGAMNMSCILFSLTPQEALTGVTKNAAKALGMDKELGTLEVGKNADFVIWDITQPAQLSYGIGLNLQKTVVKDGKIVLDDLKL